MEQIARELVTMVRTPLADSHVEMLRAAGTLQTWKAGETVLRQGQVMTHFLYLLEGEMEALNFDGSRYGGGPTLGPTQFVGEISFMFNGGALLKIRAIQDTTCIAVPRAKMLELMALVPEMSDIILTVFAARRRAMIEREGSGVIVIGAEADRAIGRVAVFLNRNRIPYKNLSLADADAFAVASGCGVSRPHPMVIFGEDKMVEDPTPRKLAQLLGIDREIEEDKTFDVVIVGGGPAGIAAGVYAGSEGLCALVIEDMTVGGQAGTSSRIENFMGFPTGISGADLCWRGEIQAVKFGTRFAIPRRAVSLEQLDDGTFCIGLRDGAKVGAKAVVVSTGVQYRRLNLDRLKAFEGAGVFYAATDLEAKFCRNTEAIVIGGGNSAGQAAMYMSRAASHVHVLVRRTNLAASMSTYLSQRLEQDPRITVHFQTEAVELCGEERLERVVICNKASGEERTIHTQAMFIMIGAKPYTDWLSGLVALDERGFVLTGAAAGGRSVFETSCHGIFAVGDVRAGSTKRVASSVGEGSVVISHVWSHVNGLE
ncbi:MAG: FAD-dependent oxidoreductase [Myxococcota bacterium]